MLDLLVELIAGVIAVLIFLGIALVLLTIVGFVALVAVAIIVGLINEVVGFYRQRFGIQGLHRRTREALDKRERQFFDQAMQQLAIRGVDNPKAPSEETLARWREEDEELPGDAKRRGEEEKGREKKRGDGPLGGYY